MCFYQESPSKYSDPQTINQVDRPSVLSSDHLTETTEAVTKGRPSTINIVTAAEEFSGSQESQTHLSPFFTKAKKHIKSIMGGGHISPLYCRFYCAFAWGF